MANPAKTLCTTFRGLLELTLSMLLPPLFLGLDCVEFCHNPPGNTPNGAKKLRKSYVGSVCAH